jgi:hypothetical protein
MNFPPLEIGRAQNFNNQQFELTSQFWAPLQNKLAILITDVFAVKLNSKTKGQSTERLPSPTQYGIDLLASDTLEIAKPTIVAFRLRHISPAGTWAKSYHVHVQDFHQP